MRRWRLIRGQACVTVTALAASAWVWLVPLLDDEIGYSMPLAAPLLLARVLMPAVAVSAIGWGVSRWREDAWDQRLAAGLCGRCGYDLRGAVSERCPECGFPIMRSSR